jgi:peptidyl-prolyl cis-trans isomerase B (cyclophilin B)
MSKAPQRGKLRNPPRGRQYAYIAIVVVLLVAGGSGVYVEGTNLHNASVSSSLASAASSSSEAANSNSTSTASTSTSITPFINTPCTESTTTSSSGATGTYAMICTNLGLIEVQLFPADAPKTVANFVSLAESGFYNDLVWHRIVAGFVIQSGDPTTVNGGGNRANWGGATSPNSIPFEDDGKLNNTAGSIAMASTGAQVGGASQFYINVVNNPSLNRNYAVFGQVINGMSVVTALSKVSVVDPTSCASASPTAEACEPAANDGAYIVSITIQSTP